MRLWLALAVCGVLAGCDDPPGLTLDIVASDPATTRVLLLITDADCSDCTDVGTDTLQVEDAPVHLLSGAAHDDFADVDGSGIARVQLQNGQMTGTASAQMVVLGLDAQDEVREMARLSLDPLPDRTFAHLEMAPPPGKVDLWGSAYHCAAIPSLEADRAVELFLQPIDRDCDGTPDPIDCAPLDFHNATTVGDQDETAAQCASSDKIDGRQGCYLGGPDSCSASAGDCRAFKDPNETCAPASFCDDPACSAKITPELCAIGASARLECAIQISNGVACTPSFITVPDGQVCNDIELQTFHASGIDLVSGFTTSAHLLNAAKDDLAIATVIASTIPDTACNAKTIKVNRTQAAPDAVGAWARLQLDGADEIVPLVVTFQDSPQSSCASVTTSCNLTVDMGDTLDQCGH